MSVDVVFPRLEENSIKIIRADFEAIEILCFGLSQEPLNVEFLREINIASSTVKTCLHIKVDQNSSISLGYSELSGQ